MMDRTTEQNLIAALLDLSEANVRVRLHRGLKRLKAELEQ